MKNWYIVNERLLALELVHKEARGEDWIEEWNNLIDVSKKIAGCIKRERYEAKQEGETTREGIDVESVSGHLAEEKAQLGSIREVVGEGSTDSVLSPHLAEEQV